ncbi:MAG: hypothetical protein KC505_06810 [Myxococcales bacterium]|nr:hypothetical protein [Myxococcales bacterium]USN51031.1 MAG: hypothetical protein H6731_01060 [Myxococcales bacterium]
MMVKLLVNMLVLFSFALQADLCPSKLKFYNKDKKMLLKGNVLQVNGYLLTCSKHERDNLASLKFLFHLKLELIAEENNEEYSVCRYGMAKGLFSTSSGQGEVKLISHQIKKLDNFYEIAHKNKFVFQITTMAHLEKIIAQEIPENELLTTAICFDFDATLANLINPQMNSSEYIYEAVEPMNQSIVRALKQKVGFVGICSSDSINANDQNKINFLTKAGIGQNDYAAGFQDKFEGLQALLNAHEDLPLINNFILVDDSEGRIYTFTRHETRNHGKIIGVLYKGDALN